MLSLIVGLGNPGAEYDKTRHNVGFEVLDLVSRREVLPPAMVAGLSRISRLWVGERLVTLAWPLTFMNRSGQAVSELMDRLELVPEELLVVVDDFNLPLGSLRFRPSGSDGGHNGLASIIEDLGCEHFPRLRLGVGPLPDTISSVEFVLERFRAAESKPKEKMIETAAEAVRFAMDSRLEMAMSNYNSNPARS